MSEATMIMMNNMTMIIISSNTNISIPNMADGHQWRIAEGYKLPKCVSRREQKCSKLLILW